MLNTSGMDFNSTSVPFNFKFCLNSLHVGMVVSYLAFFLCFFLGTPAHCWLLWLSLRDGWKIKPTQVFLLNMTVLELIFSALCAVEILNALIFDSDTLWVVIFAFISLCWVGRPLMQICICIERYLAVLHPIIFLKYKGLEYRSAVAAVVWLMVAALAVCEIFLDTLAEYVFNVVFFIAVIVISFCCVSVLCALKHSGPGDRQIPVEKDRDVGNQQKRNAFNTIFSGLLIILLTYLPQVSLSFIHVIQTDKALFNCNIVPIMNTFNILGMMITPMQKNYKKGAIKCLKTSKSN